MASPLPIRPSIDHTPRARSSFVLGDEASTAVLEALSSETARDILSALSEGPGTASDVAEVAGTSLQNAHYHLQNLRGAELIADVGTWYSEKGKEMTVYALTSERLELRFSASPGEPNRPNSGRTSQPARISGD